MQPRMSTRPWIVPQHDPFLVHEPELWSVEAELRPGSPMRRRMGVARLAEGRVALFNAVPLRDEALREIESVGRVEWVCIPAAYHTLDLAAFHARFPAARIVAPPGQVAGRVRRRVPVAGGWELLPGSDPRVRVIPLRGTKGEVVVVAGGTMFFPGDALMNLAHVPGIGGLLLRLVGTSGGPKVTPVAKLFVVSDREALRTHLEELAAWSGLRRVVPCHGAVIEDDAAGVLRRVAAAL
jgi:hypothetical protein